MMNWKTKLSEKKVQSSTPTPHPIGSLSVSAIWSLLVLGKINSQSLKIEDRYIDESAAFFLPPCKIDFKKKTNLPEGKTDPEWKIRVRL